ncbi:MAG: hypothetical protein AAGI72_21385 [Pseudomonadota bacterium]
MPTSLLEIVDLGDGEIVLKRAEEEGGSESETDKEPLVTIRFSEESRVYIMDQSMEVAKAMIQAGIQAAAQLAEQADIEMEVEQVESSPPTLH